MEVPIREFQLADIPQLIELCREHAEFENAPWDVRDRRADLQAMFHRSEDAFLWVVDGDSELAGFASATLERSTWDAGRFLHMDCLFLRPPYRGSGLGRAIMQRVIDAARELDALNVQWQTPAWNSEAIRFYERFGANSAPKTRFTLSLDERDLSVQGDRREGPNS